MPVLSRTSLGNPKHLERFIQMKSGKTVEEIAKIDNVSVDIIKQSIRRIEIQQGILTNEYLQQALVDIVLKSSPKVQKAIDAALTATVEKTVKGDNGEERVINVPDTETQLKAVAEVRQIAQASQPRGGPSVKVGVGVQVGQGSISSTSYVGAEERMRAIRREQMSLPAKTTVTIDATSGIAAEEDADGDNSA